MAFHEKTASTGTFDLLWQRYSSAATGRLDPSASPGSKGLQAVISTSSGSLGSVRVTVAKGKRQRNDALAKRGRP